MTERVKGCWVSFDRDIREDDVEPLIAAIRQLRSVCDVTLTLEDDNGWMNRSRIHREFAKEIYDAVKRLNGKPT